MTQPSDWRLPDGPERSAQHGEPPQPGQPQYQQPTSGQPPELPFYGPGPYPPTPFQPPKRSRGNLLVAFVSVLVIVGGGVAAVLLLTGGNDHRKHAAGLAGSPAHRPQVPSGRTASLHVSPSHRPRTAGRSSPRPTARPTPPPKSHPTASPTSHPSASPSGKPRHAPAVVPPSCARIQDVLNRTGAFDAGRITVSKGDSPKHFDVPLPAGAPRTICTLHTARFSRFVQSRMAHVVVIAWRGVTEHAYAAALRRAGYGGVGRRYRLWQGGKHHPRLPSLVTTTISHRLVTFYRIG